MAMKNKKDELDILKKELSNYLEKDMLWLQDIEEIKKEKEQCKKEYRNNLKVKYKNKILKNLCVTGYVVLVAIPFLLVGSLAVGGCVYGATGLPEFVGTGYYYMDNTGVCEKLEYNVDSSQIIIRTPYKEKNGKYVRKVYAKDYHLDKEEKEEFFNKDYLEALATFDCDFVKEEILDEKIEINSIDNKGIVAYTEEHFPSKEEVKTSDKVLGSILLGFSGFSLGGGVSFFFNESIKNKKKLLKRKTRNYKFQYEQTKREEKILKKEYKKYRKV